MTYSERTDSGKEIEHKLTKREREEVLMIEQLVIQYFNIIRKQLQVRTICDNRTFRMIDSFILRSSRAFQISYNVHKVNH